LSVSGTGPAFRRVAIAGGGTAGHVTTGLSIMDAYRGALGAEIYFIGCAGGFESSLVPSAGFRLELIPGGPLARQNLSGKARALVLLPSGVWCARKLLRATATQLVIGLGSYGSGAAVLAARSLGIASVIHEANVVPGLANRWLQPVADRVCISWEASRRFFPAAGVTVTGIPVRPEIVHAAPSGLPSASQHSGPRRILVIGGSEGSTFLNKNVPLLLRRVRALGAEIAVRHQTGFSAVEPVQALYEGCGFPARVERFIVDMAEAYSQAQFVIAAPGAITLAELAIMGLPSLLIPSRAVAADHQTPNARAYAEQTGGMWCSERDWDPTGVAVRLAALLNSPTALLDQAQRTRALAHPGAARAVVEVCESLMAGRWASS
jgi:UDP-N-acetylglucosamine--N-acetylmuramyl-(pentapeptide) pyrophosphoryl-undecaprenol N-acetylglucosamine transferase